jgi:hypothetical protein
MKIDLYTLCWNDGDMLPFFFRHYDRFVSRYFIFDDGSTDASLSILRNRENVEVHKFVRMDPTSFALSEQAFSNECWKASRGVADWVIVTDIDEHLYHPDMFALLVRYKTKGMTFIPAFGYHMISEEFPGPSELLCQTRTRGVPRQGMCKPSLFDPMAIVEVNYDLGRHQAAPTGNVRLPPQAELLLLHYKSLDFNRTLGRALQLRTGLGPKDIENGWGIHYFASEAQMKQNWSALLEKAVDVHKHTYWNYPFSPWWEALKSRAMPTQGADEGA